MWQHLHYTGPPLRTDAESLGLWLTGSDSSVLPSAGETGNHTDNGSHPWFLLLFLQVGTSCYLFHDLTKNAADSSGHKETDVMHDCCNMNYPEETFRPCIIHQKVPQRPAGGFSGLFWGALLPKHQGPPLPSTEGNCHLEIIVLLPSIWLRRLARVWWWEVIKRWV